MSRQDVLTHASKISAEFAHPTAVAEYESYSKKSDDELSIVRLFYYMLDSTIKCNPFV